MCYLTRAVQPIYWVSCRCVILQELYSLFIGYLVDVLSWMILVFVCNNVCQTDNPISEFYIQ